MHTGIVRVEHVQRETKRVSQRKEVTREVTERKRRRGGPWNGEKNDVARGGARTLDESMRNGLSAAAAMRRINAELERR